MTARVIPSGFGRTGEVQVEDRRCLTKREKAELCLTQSGKCAICADKLRQGTIEYDHVIPLALGGTQDLDNWQALCTPCHRNKTSGLDAPAIAKAKRLAGETGQLKRRRERPYPLIRSRNDLRRR